MQALLDTRARRYASELGVFVGRSLHDVHSRISTCAKCSGNHLGDSYIFGPRDARLLSLPEFFHAEMAALTTEAAIGDDAPDLFPVLKAGELRVAEGRTQFDGLDAHAGQLLEQ